jgi:hypothetical protein
VIIVIFSFICSCFFMDESKLNGNISNLYEILTDRRSRLVATLVQTYTGHLCNKKETVFQRDAAKLWDFARHVSVSDFGLGGALFILAREGATYLQFFHQSCIPTFWQREANNLGFYCRRVSPNLLWDSFRSAPVL